MAENTKLLIPASSLDSGGSEEKMTPQKISISDHKSDSFVIDMDSFSHAQNKDINQIQNSRITLQRNLSRKGSQRMEKKMNSTGNDRDSFADSSSPKGSSTPEKAVGASVGTNLDHGGNGPQVHHQITVTAGNINTTASDNKFHLRRNSFKRPGSTRFDPKKVLLIFATLSSIGTILLIYFTLSISKMNGDESALD